MKKHWILFYTCILVLISCSRFNATKEMNEYLEIRKTFIERQIELATMAEEQLLKEDDRNHSLEILRNDVIPSFEQLVRDIKDVSLKTKEVKDVHKEFVKAMELQLDVYKKYEEALEKNNKQLFFEAEQKVEEVHKLLDKHETQLIKVCKGLGIELKLKK